MSKKAMKIGAFMTGAMFGGLVGGALGLLYAPRSGEETRKLIRDKSTEMKDQAVERGTELRHQAEEAAEKARLRFEETAQHTRERATELQHRGQAFLDEQRSRVMQAMESGKTRFQKETAAAEPNGVESA